VFDILLNELDIEKLAARDRDRLRAEVDAGAAMAAALEDIGEHAGSASEISHADTGRKSSAHVRGRREHTMLRAIFKKLPTQKILAPQREAARKGATL
jgi:hypothetical protein